MMIIFIIISNISSYLHVLSLLVLGTGLYILYSLTLLIAVIALEDAHYYDGHFTKEEGG